MTTATNYDDDEKPALAGGLWTVSQVERYIYTNPNTHTHISLYHCIVCKTNIGQI